MLTRIAGSLLLTPVSNQAYSVTNTRHVNEKLRLPSQHYVLREISYSGYLTVYLQVSPDQFSSTAML